MNLEILHMDDVTERTVAKVAHLAGLGFGQGDSERKDG